MKLSHKLLLAVLPVLGLVLSLGGWLLIRQNFTASLTAMQRQAESEQLRERSALLAELLARDGDPAAYLPEYGAAVARYAGGERSFALFTAEGVLAYSAMPAGVQLAWQQQLAADPAGALLRTGTDGSHWYLIADSIPVRDTAVVYVGAYPMDTAYEAQAMLLRAYFGIELVAFAAAGLAVWGMISRLTRPLRALDDASRRIAAGEYARRTALTGTDEIAALSRSFDGMADALQAELEQRALAVRQREDFIAALTHELKTPMTSILGYAQMLRTGVPDPEQRERAAGYIVHEARRLETLSRKLLDLMQVTRQGITPGATPLAALLTMLRRALPQQAPDCLPLEIRAPRTPCVLQGDADLLCDLLLNLVRNAARAEPKDGKVHLTVTADADRVRFAVWDNGRGIPPADLPRLTEPFYMVDKSRARAGGGSGVGLALCQAIARAHGTALEFASRPGVGTVVRFSVARQPQAGAPAGGEADRERAGAQPAQRTPAPKPEQTGQTSAQEAAL